jgi:hypothetical protein
MTMSAEDHRRKAVDDDQRKREAGWKRSWDKLTDEWDILHKGLTGLLVANATGMVACLTLLRDYDTAKGKLDGLGVFIWLFGVGLLLAIWAAIAMVFLRRSFFVVKWSWPSIPGIQ